MMKRTLVAFSVAVSVFAASGAERSEPLAVAADLLQVDPGTRSLVASGNVSAVRAPFRLLSDSCSRDADGVYRFGDATTFTTCTNDLSHLHWHVRGGFTYADGDYAEVSDAAAYFWGVPVCWLPWAYLPLTSAEGLQIMPGYIGRWGAYLMTKAQYHIAGSERHEEGAWLLNGATRFDMRWKQGLALGQDFDWMLGDYGRGRAKVYYAWDKSDYYDDYWRDERHYHYRNWGSTVPDDRYGFEFAHRWEPTERDTVRMQASVFSDSWFRRDFMRTSLFMIKNQFLGYDANEFAWEHNETWFGAGLSVSGPLNDFIGGTARLPEIHFDVMPLPVWSLPVNYESSTRFGFLRRRTAQLGDAEFGITPYTRYPGEWADYETFRMDSYHRFSLPFKVADVLSVVPRLGFRGTYWAHGGETCLTGYEKSRAAARDVFRSILEGGVTFAARGTADYDGWRHTVEPYFDVLAQEAWYNGVSGGRRPFVFDAVDASLDWSEQFASRGRNLPYTWYGVTPGVRNVFDTVDEQGAVRRLLDVELYCALQLNDTDWAGTDRLHKLAETGRPNYGRNAVTPVSGFRFAWHPDRDTSVSAMLEYDSEYNAVALAGVQARQRLSNRFSCYLSFYQTDYRRWDFSSSPYDPETMNGDEFNLVRYSFVQTGFEHELCDAIAWGPYLRWDCRDGRLDSAGTWIDYRTDCLGFRFSVEYDNKYTRVDGSERGESWDFGFYVYLRAFGAGSGNLFNP
mgnify:CR=1 FL=1